MYVAINLIFFLIPAIDCLLKDKFALEFSDDRADQINIISNCVKNISEKYSAGRNIIFVSEQLNTELSTNIIRQIEQNRKIVSPNNISSQIGFYFLMHSKDHSFTHILEQIPANSIMRFIVIIDFQDKIDLRPIQNIFDEFWSFQIIDVIVLVPFNVSRNIRIYTFYPFSNTRCGEAGPPVLINIWNSERKLFTGKTDLFSRYRKVFNLHRCPLKCTGIHRPPESEIIKSPQDGTWKLSGTGIKVFKFIEKYMNFTPELNVFHKPEQKHRHKLKNITKFNVENSGYKFDIGFGKFIRILDTEPNADFVTENKMDCFTWAVPKGFGRQPSIWTKYVIEYSKITWLFICVNIFIMTGIFKLVFWRYKLTKNSDFHKFEYLLFYTFFIFIGVVVKMRSKSTMVRILVSQWLIYGFVITASYQAYLGSLMTIRRTEPEINGQDDLANTNLNLVTRQEMFYVLNESASTSEEFKNIVDRLFILPPVNFDTIIERMIAKRDIAVFTSKRELIHYAKKWKTRKNDSHKIHIFDNCIIKSYSSAFMLRKGSPYYHAINHVLMRLFETGIYDNWDTNYVKDEISHIFFTEDTVLVLRELYGAFVILFIGLLISTSVFILEILYSVHL